MGLMITQVVSTKVICFAFGTGLMGTTYIQLLPGAKRPMGKNAGSHVAIGWT
jgi:hypothetical protein